MAGLTPTGFVRKRLEDVKLQLEAGFRGGFGDIDVSPQSLFGQTIGPVSQIAADLWEGLEQVYNSQYAESAEGVSLEAASQNLAVSRLGAAPSSLTVSVTGTEGTPIPVGTIFRGSDANFISQAAGEISQDNLDRFKINITASAIGELFTVTIDSVPVTIVASSTNPTTTAQEIATAINAEPVAATAEADQQAVNIYAKGVAFVGTATSTFLNVAVLEIASPVLAYSVVPGAFDVSVGAISGLLTPVAGVDGATNRKPGVQGRVIESDADLRRRRRIGVRGAGAGSVDAITARLLQDVPNILSVNGFDNKTDAPDIFGRPPHSMEFVIEGAEDLDIANKIWELKPGGIPTFGNTTIPINDIAGNPQEVKFSRPAPLYIWARVNIDTYNDEETFPATGTQQIADFIVAAGNRLAAGVDVVNKRLYSAVYQVPGLEDITIELFASTNIAASPVYAEQNITVAPSQRARFDVSRVVVVTP